MVCGSGGFRRQNFPQELEQLSAEEAPKVSLVLPGSTSSPSSSAGTQTDGEQEDCCAHAFVQTEEAQTESRGVSTEAGPESLSVETQTDVVPPAPETCNSLTQTEEPAQSVEAAMQTDVCASSSSQAVQATAACLDQAVQTDELLEQSLGASVSSADATGASAEDVAEDGTCPVPPHRPRPIFTQQHQPPKKIPRLLPPPHPPQRPQSALAAGDPLPLRPPPTARRPCPLRPPATGSRNW